jgi:hypothetical protein
MGCFHASRLADLRMKPINQLWRDHMLAGSMLLADEWKEGMFVVLYPAENTHAAAAIRRYQACLADASTFGSWTLESFVAGACDIVSSQRCKLTTRFQMIFRT